MELNSDDNESPDDRRYTLAELGLAPEPHVRQTPVGPTRLLRSLSLYEWIYLLVSVVTVIGLAAVSVDRLVALPKSSQDFTFALLLLSTTVFLMVYIYQGVVREYVLELIAFVATIIILMLYVIVNYCATDRPSNIKTLRLIITCILAPVLIVAGLVFVRKYWRSKDLIYRTVGATIEMQDMCQQLFIANSLLLFDVQLTISSLILWLRNGIQDWTQTEITVVSIGALITIVWMTSGFLGMRFENKRTIYIFWSISIFGPIFIIWNFVRYIIGSGDERLQDSVFVSGIIALIIRVITVVFVILVFYNFNKGLKQRVYQMCEQNTTTDANKPVHT